MNRTPSDYLTHAQLASLRTKLLAEQRKHGRVDEARVPVEDVQERLADPIDEADETAVKDELAGRASHSDSHLGEVDAALARFEAGSYGISELSGDPIGYERLAAVPWARLTAAEQEDLERQQRDRRGPRESRTL